MILRGMAVSGGIAADQTGLDAHAAGKWVGLCWGNRGEIPALVREQVLDLA